MPMNQSIISQVATLEAEIINTRRDIYRHPELSNREERTAALIAQRLEQLGLEVRTGIARHGVMGILRGAGDRVIGARANMDALPVDDVLDVPYRSTIPGVKHACGHDAETAILLGVAEVLSGLRKELAGTIVFIFQPAEEGPPEGEEGGAALMIKEGVLQSEPAVEEILALHMMPTLDAKTIGYSVGPILASNDNFDIKVIGEQTHAAFPHTGVDSILLSSYVIQGLQTMVAREFDAIDSVVISPGVIRGGNRWNIIPENVLIEGTVRTLSPEIRSRIPSLIDDRIGAIIAAYGGRHEFRYHHVNPVTVNNRELARAAVTVLESTAEAGHIIEGAPMMASEDFSHFAEKIPAFYFFLGVRNEARGIMHMVHSPKFDIDESSLAFGVTAFSNLLLERTRSQRINL
jgi:amidohydrolase